MRCRAIEKRSPSDERSDERRPTDTLATRDAREDARPKVLRRDVREVADRKPGGALERRDLSDKSRYCTKQAPRCRDVTLERACTEKDLKKKHQELLKKGKKIKKKGPGRKR